MFQRAFSVSTREPAALLFAPGGHSPTGGVCCMVQRWNVCAIVFWRVVWYRAGTFLCMRSCPCPSWSRRGRGAAVVPWTSCRGCVRRAVASLDMAVVTWLWRPWVWPWRGAAVAVASAVFVSLSCGCDTPMNASVCNGFATSHYPNLRNQLVAYKMGANKQTTTKRKERYSSGYADRDGNPGAPKNRRHG